MYMSRVGMYPRGEGPGSLDRGQEATGGTVKSEASILPGRALTESRQSLHVTPDRTRIHLVRFCHRVRLRGLLLRQIQPLHDGVEYPVTGRCNLPGGRPEDHRTVVRGVAHIQCKLGYGTNNDAEWLALIHAAEMAEAIAKKAEAILELAYLAAGGEDHFARSGAGSTH